MGTKIKTEQSSPVDDEHGVERRDENKKGKKKKKRDKTKVETEGENVHKEFNEPQVEVKDEVKEKKKKKKRDKMVAETEEDAYNEPPISPEEVKKKKKKKREKRDVEIEDWEVEKITIKDKTDVKNEQKEQKITEMKVKAEIIREHSSKISPLVGYFSSGYDPYKRRRSIHFKDQGQQPPQLPRVELLRNVNRKSRLQLVVSPNHSQVDFVGTNYLGEAIAPQVCNYAIGVLDKETKTLKIVPVAGNKIFRLEPRVDEPESSDNEPSGIIKEELTAKDKADKQKGLTLTYSTKREIAKLKKNESLHRHDPRSQEELDKKVDYVKIDKEAFEEAETTNDARNIPPYDMDATTPQTAYPLDKIIFKGEWDFLLDILQLSHIGAQVRPDVYPSFVCNRIYKLDESKDEETKQTLACIFSYITHLIKFKDKHSMDGVSSAKHHKIPSILSLKFSDMFGNPESKRLAEGKKDFLISYVLVLTLFADDFRSDPSDIAKDLRVDAGALRSHYEHLGCKAVREQNTTLFTLPVPLQFQAVRRKRNRAKGGRT